MIESMEIKNYKSIKDMTLPLGRVTVLIGENGSGKSNILEALTLLGATAANKLDNEFLVSRGIRVTDPNLMRAAFNQKSDKYIELAIKGPANLNCRLQHSGKPFAPWESLIQVPLDQNDLTNFEARPDDEAYNELLRKIVEGRAQGKSKEWQTSPIRDFVIYSPENTALRTFERENQIQPLGINGEGLFKLLKVMSEQQPEKFKQIKERLHLIDWFDDFEIPSGLAMGETNIRIWDKYLQEGIGTFTQRSANEGFLFLLFYLTLFISDDTPKFFAVDNIEASLNPKLCTRLIKELVSLARENNKQAVFTTHNPAILDGLNLDDEDQKVLVVSRKRDGQTRLKALQKPRLQEGEAPIKLSTAFIS